LLDNCNRAIGHPNEANKKNILKNKVMLPMSGSEAMFDLGVCDALYNYQSGKGLKLAVGEDTEREMNRYYRGEPCDLIVSRRIQYGREW